MPRSLRVHCKQSAEKRKEKRTWMEWFNVISNGLPITWSITCCGKTAAISLWKNKRGVIALVCCSSAVIQTCWPAMHHRWRISAKRGGSDRVCWVQYYHVNFPSCLLHLYYRRFHQETSKSLRQQPVSILQSRRVEAVARYVLFGTYPIFEVVDTSDWRSRKSKPLAF